MSSRPLASHFLFLLVPFPLLLLDLTCYLPPTGGSAAASVAEAAAAAPSEEAEKKTNPEKIRRTEERTPMMYRMKKALPQESNGLKALQARKLQGEPPSCSLLKDILQPDQKETPLWGLPGAPLTGERGSIRLKGPPQWYPLNYFLIACAMEEEGSASIGHQRGEVQHCISRDPGAPLGAVMPLGPLSCYSLFVSRPKRTEGCRFPPMPANIRKGRYQDRKSLIDGKKTLICMGPAATKTQQQQSKGKGIKHAKYRK